MLDFYRSVMDADQNPLRELAPAQRFQIMVVLSLMWSAIFTAAAGLWSWYGGIVAIHLLLALGVLMTGVTFAAAKRRSPATYRDCPTADGTTRYDDVWGG